MRLSIDHRTRYRFTAPQARLVQLLRLTPIDSDQQTVASWRIDVDCDARMRDGRDGFGNRITMLYAVGPLDGIDIHVSGEVLTSGDRGQVSGTVELLPPALYLRFTPATDAGPAIERFAAAAAGDDAGKRALALAEALAARFTVERALPEPGLTARDAFDREAATPRDMAQMMIAAARAAGMPARYVSGHHLPGRSEGEPATAHGWVEVHDAASGWMGIDPSIGAPVDDSYVRVAIGLDAAQAAPVAGSRLGAGEERLDVAVQVEALGRNGGASGARSE